MCNIKLIILVVLIITCYSVAYDNFFGIASNGAFVDETVVSISSDMVISKQGQVLAVWYDVNPNVENSIDDIDGIAKRWKNNKLQVLVVNNENNISDKDYIGNETYSDGCEIVLKLSENASEKLKRLTSGNILKYLVIVRYGEIVQVRQVKEVFDSRTVTITVPFSTSEFEITEEPEQSGVFSKIILSVAAVAIFVAGVLLPFPYTVKLIIGCFIGGISSVILGMQEDYVMPGIVIDIDLLYIALGSVSGYCLMRLLVKKVKGDIG